MNRILNFRTLTEKSNKDGRKLKENQIFRSGNPGKADREDIETLLSLGINNIYDFRNTDEVKRDRTIDHPEIKVTHIEIINTDYNIFSNLKEFGNRTEELMVEMYRDKFPESRGYRDFISMILNQKTPQFLFHCTAGKDRTGIGSLLLMTLLGFEEETIYAEYLRMDDALKKVMADSVRRGFEKEGIHSDEKSISALSSVQKKYLDAFYEGIESRYGNMDSYIRDFLNISEEQIFLLKERYLD